MVRYFLFFLAVALCLAGAGVSGSTQQQEEDLATGVAIAKSHAPNRLTRMPKTVPWGMSPKEEKKVLREIAEEEELMRQQFRRESEETEEAVKKLRDALETAEAKQLAVRAEREKAQSVPCVPSAKKDVPAQTFLAVVGAATHTACDQSKAEKEADEAVKEAERALKDAEAMDTAAKTALRNSEFIPVNTLPLGDGRSHIGRPSGDMGRRPSDGAHWPTVAAVNAAFLLLIAEALFH